VRWAAPVCLALVIGMLIGATSAKREKALEPFGSMRLLDYSEPQGYHDVLIGRK
jgi:hypothetical protein